MDTQLIEQTSKKFKGQILLSVFAMLSGVVWIIVGVNKENATSISAIPGILLSVAGMFWLVVTKFRIWWNHK